MFRTRLIEYLAVMRWSWDIKTVLIFRQMADRIEFMEYMTKNRKYFCELRTRLGNVVTASVTFGPMRWIYSEQFHKTRRIITSNFQSRLLNSDYSYRFASLLYFLNAYIAFSCTYSIQSQFSKI